MLTWTNNIWTSNNKFISDIWEKFTPSSFFKIFEILKFQKTIEFNFVIKRDLTKLVIVDVLHLTNPKITLITLKDYNSNSLNNVSNL